MRENLTSHAYPADLAACIVSRWKSAGALAHDEGAPVPSDDDFLPSEAVLEQLISTAYQASLLREEDRPVTFRMLVGDPSQFPREQGPPTGLHRLIFTSYRLFTAHELRRVSPSAPYYRSLIGVTLTGDEGPEIWGIAHSGPRWLQATHGGRRTPPRLPPALIISVLGPGRIEVSRGTTRIGRLEAGEIVDDTLDVFRSQWLPADFAPIRAQLMALHEEARERAGSQWGWVDEHLISVMAQHMVKRLLAVVRSAQHGGSIVFIPPELVRDVLVHDRHIKLKYKFLDEEARARFRTLLVSILNTLAEAHGGTAELSRKIGWTEYVNSRSDAIAALDEALFEMSHLIAGLTAVDGAVLITDYFELLGYGGEIVAPDAVPSVARALDLEANNRAIESTETVGTRHRSAYRLCNAVHDALAIVISQDGGVRFVKWMKGAVTYWDHIALNAQEANADGGES